MALRGPENVGGGPGRVLRYTNVGIQCSIASAESRALR
jgi:hypothetical protein